MKIRVRLFAGYREAYEQDDLDLEVPEGITCAEVQQRLATERPVLARWEAVVRYGINQEFAAAQTRLSEGDELVLIPPVSGG